MALVLAALVSLVVLLLVLLVTDIDISQSRRIEKQVERERRRIRAKTLRGWSSERIAKRYPSLPYHHIESVRQRMERSIEAQDEIRLLKSMWMMDGSEASPEG